MEHNWKDYFSFTKKERTGIMVLITLIGFSVAAPWFFPSPAPPDKATIEAFNAQRAQLEQTGADSGMRRKPHYERREEYPDVYYEPIHNKQPGMLFQFDPNTLNTAGWKKLGVSNRTIHTIQNYVAKGGYFRSPADLKKIYGLQKADCDRLMPYVQIPPVPQQASYSSTYKSKAKNVKAPPPVIDINIADTAAFIALPGIGSKLANRIVEFRNKLGGFYSVEQLAETFGLPDSTFQLIKPQLQCSGTGIRKININMADVNTLKQHPYIRWNIANAIIQYRLQHGAYRAVEDLQQIAIITPELYQKMAGYVAVE